MKSHKPDILERLEKDPMFKRNAMIALAHRDLSFFTMWGLGFDNAHHHTDWYEILQDKLYTPEWVDDMDEALYVAPEGWYNDRIMIMAPRSHSKSTCFTVNYPLWKIGTDPNIRILIVSASASQSQSFLREIKGHIEKNTQYRKIFGDLFPEDKMNPEKWTSSEIIVRRDNFRIKDPTVAAVGAGGTILSKRADIIICDDILDESNSRTYEQREKIREWFFTVLMPVLEPNGRVIVVGTAWNVEDLYHELMKTPTYKVRKRYQAIVDDRKKEVLWPERWDYDKLMDRKAEAGTTSFNKSYQNIAISDEDSVFKYAWTQEAKRKGESRKLIPEFNYSHWDLGKVTIAMGVDLAISKKEGSDFTAISVVAQVMSNGMKIPLWLEEEKYSPAETRARIVEIYERFNPGIIIVENNAYQASLQVDLAEQTAMPIKGYTTGGEKFDAEIGVNSMAVEFENGKWILPYDVNDGRTRRMTDRLVEGMLKFPSGHTYDILMATWFANTGLRQLTVSKSSGTMTVGNMKIFR